MRTTTVLCVCFFVLGGCLGKDDSYIMIPCRWDYEYVLEPQAATSMAFFDAHHGLIGNRVSEYAGSGDADLLATDDGGITWSDYSRSIRRPWSPFPMQMTGQSVVHMIAGGALYKSDTGGASWTLLPSEANETWMSIRFTDATHAFRAGSLRPQLYTGIAAYSTDGGETWTRSDPPGARYGGVFFLNSSIGWYLSSNQVFKTTDGGQNWTLLHEYVYPGSGANLHFGNFFFLDSNNGWITSDQGILRTTDGGSTWNPTEAGNGMVLLRILFLSPTNGFLVAKPFQSSSFGLYKTTDGGTSWTKEIENVGEITAAGDYLIASGQDETSGYLYFSRDQFASYTRRPAPLKSTVSHSHFVMGYPPWACM